MSSSRRTAVYSQFWAAVALTAFLAEVAIAQGVSPQAPPPSPALPLLYIAAAAALALVAAVFATRRTGRRKDLNPEAKEPNGFTNR